MSTTTIERRPVAGAAVAVAALALVVSAHAWAEALGSVGPSAAYADFYLRFAAPLLLVALLIALGWLRPGSAVIVGALMALLTVLVMRSLSAVASGDEAVFSLPWLLSAGVAAYTSEDFRARVRGTATAQRLGLLSSLLALGVALGTLRLVDVEGIGEAQTFTVVFVSIVVEALPFVLLGATVSAAIEVFVPERTFTRIAGLPLRLQVPGVALAGMTMPVCECGSVPVARRLISKGVHPAAGIAFMLASPVINPVVLLSTAVAFQGRGAFEMVAGRLLVGLAVALVAGFALGRANFKIVTRPPGEDDHHHHGSRGRAVLDHTSSELLFMGRFVVLGAALAALLQTTVPQSAFTGVLAAPVVGALVLMALAFVLSLCSEADAFVALSFTGFSIGPLLAFLTFGPVLDIKLALLYAASFGRAFVVRLFFVVTPVVLAGAMLWEVMFG